MGQATQVRIKPDQVLGALRVLDRRRLVESVSLGFEASCGEQF